MWWRRRMLVGVGLLGAAGAAAVLCAGCPSDGTGTPTTQPTFSGVGLPRVTTSMTLRMTKRRFLTGCVPAAFTIDSGDQGQRYFARVKQSARYGDAFVARPRMDWVRFGPNGDGLVNLDIAEAVRIARENGMRHVVIEIDPVADRRNVGLLPPELEGKNFADPEVRDPIKRMAVEIALQLQPDYLSIGVEMNGYYESNPEDFENYVTLHKETYDLVKAVAPNVQFIAAFNLEALQGFYGDLDQYSNHPPQWFLFDMLEPKVDALAFATLPFGFYTTPLQLPDDYLSRIEEHTTRDILFTEIGWPGSGTDPLYTFTTQSEYVADMARLIDKMTQARLVVWTTMFDADPEVGSVITPAFRTLGLFDYDDQPKPALDIWRQIVALPYEP